MSFRDLKLFQYYRTGGETGDIVKDFYIPSLKKAILYKRAVGYFTSNSLAIAASGLSSFIENGGKMQLIASPYLQKEDIEAIEYGYKAREEIVSNSLLRQIELKNIDKVSEERLNYLAWLVYENRLDIKIALLKDQSKYGIYHEKLGILEDGLGNIIAFSGSSNETEGGLINNFESIDVFLSWEEADKNRVNAKVKAFENLWNDTNDYLEVIDFPKAAKNKLLSFRKSTYVKTDPVVEKIEIREQKTDYQKDAFFPRIPQQIKVRVYQQEAIRSWFKNNGQGLLEMATGTGKTITALSAISKLYESIGRLGVIIVCPYIHLVDQWVEDMKMFNMFPVIAYGSNNWEEHLSDQISLFKTGISDHFSVIMTNDTFVLERMQNQLKKLGDDAVFIADEAHHLGAEKIRSKLIQSIPYRLALSATPNRWYDDIGTEKMLSYFGNKVVFEFGLDKAIGKYLTEYFYFPHLVYLDEDESHEYYELTRKLVKFFGDDSNKNSEIKERLLIKRARILSSARNKLNKLYELMSIAKDSKFNIIYCGDSNVDGEKQINKVIKMLGKGLSMKVHSFTSRENNEERRELLERFSKGQLQALVAIRCLDEGVDVPATQNAYILASSTNPREFIQRRGRVLRKHKDKEYSYIHDFIVLPRNLEEVRFAEPSLFNIERNLVRKELVRLSEFARLALNGPLAEDILTEVKRAYNLLDM